MLVSVREDAFDVQARLENLGATALVVVGGLPKADQAPQDRQ